MTTVVVSLYTLSILNFVSILLLDLNILLLCLYSTDSKCIDVVWYMTSDWFMLQTMFSKLVDFVKGDSDIPQIDTHWISESGIIDVMFLLGPKPNNVFQQYAKLTGTTALPPVSFCGHPLATLSLQL